MSRDHWAHVFLAAEFKRAVSLADRSKQSENEPVWRNADSVPWVRWAAICTGAAAAGTAPWDTRCSAWTAAVPKAPPSCPRALREKFEGWAGRRRGARTATYRRKAQLRRTEQPAECARHVQTFSMSPCKRMGVDNIMRLEALRSVANGAAVAVYR